MQQGMAAAAQVRSDGGVPAHIDAVTQPETSVIEGVVMHHYPIATYCALRLMQPWIDSLVERAGKAHTAEMDKWAAEGEGEPPRFALPTEVELMQVYAFAKPEDAYKQARSGEGPLLLAAMHWFDKTGGRSDRIDRLKRLHWFVLEQCGLLEAVNPQEPVLTTPGTVLTEAPGASELPAAATPDSP